MKIPSKHIKKLATTQLHLMQTKASLLQQKGRIALRKVELKKAKGKLSMKKRQLLEAKDHFYEERKARKQMRRIRKQVRMARGGQAWYKHQHILPLLKHLLPVWIVALMLLLPTSNCYGQILEALSSENSNIDSIPTSSLRAEVDAIAFFHDNEYSSDIRKGYSLPGVRIIPHLAYNPIQQINIELGASMLFYNGANKYPCYAYHDIGTWKGDQYQHGAHVLPWVRLQASLKHIDVVLGNIYGGSNHRLSTPLYNAEQNLSADPENGIQILVHRRHFEADTWLNWQSYIFEESSHQEAFTVGENMRLLWGKTGGRWQWYTPLQVLIQHRGGEQDNTNMGVQTLSNAALGAAIEGKPIRSRLDLVSAQLNAVVSYQQKGHLWPFNTGFAIHAGAQMKMINHLHVAADYLYAPKQFVSLFGNPFFSTISLRSPGTTYQGIHTLRTAVGYEYCFAKSYTLGAHAECFSEHAPANDNKPSLSEVNFSFGLYLRVAPSILLKRF